MNVLWEGRLDVAYAQAYVSSGRDGPEAGPFVGQVNGLCGAATAGSLFLVTGLHTGQVGFRAAFSGSAPALSDKWEEAVEVSFLPSSAHSAIVTWHGEEHPLRLPQEWLRARYCGRGMDAAKSAEMLDDDGALLDEYALYFWPTPGPEQDVIVRTTSETAAYWHRSWGAATRR